MRWLIFSNARLPLCSEPHAKVLHCITQCFDRIACLKAKLLASLGGIAVPEQSRHFDGSLIQSERLADQGAEATQQMRSPEIKFQRGLKPQNRKARKSRPTFNQFPKGP